MMFDATAETNDNKEAAKNDLGRKPISTTSTIVDGWDLLCF